MKKLIYLSVYCLICWTVALGQAGPSYRVNGRNIAMKTFDAEMKKMLDYLGVPGMSLAVIGNNQVVYHRVYGYKDIGKKDTLDDETIFEAASLSKSFLVFVAHRLVDEGKLDLDKPMYQYLDYGPLKHDPRYKLITPRMILSHCSGIENWQSDNNPDTLEIVSPPGERFVYSGEGYQYLAKVVEQILHKSYGEYVDEMVVKPLGLTRTYSAYSADGTFPTDYATGYDNFEKPVSKWKNSNTIPASGMHLTASDYARLIIAIFDRSYLSQKETAEITRAGIRMDKNNPSLYFGLGFGVICKPDDTIIFHNGSNKGFKDWVWYSVVRRSGFVVLTNGDRGVATANMIDSLSVGLGLQPYFGTDAVFEQYPDNASMLLKVYREHGLDDMFTKVDSLEKRGDLSVKTLNQVAWFFFGENKTAKRLLDESIRLYPQSPYAYFLLGELNLALGEYDLAYKNLTRSKELNFYMVPLDPDIKKCADKLKVTMN